MLAYIREIAPGDVVDEIRENAYNVTMEEFCHSLDICYYKLRKIYVNYVQ